MPLRAATFAAGQIVGHRERQEDYYGIADLSGQDEERLLFVLADGMGGHPGAADAARIVVESFCTSVQDEKEGPLSQRLRAALDRANATLAEPQDAMLEGAGCTLVAAAIENGGVAWISVGDSGLFLWRSGRLQRLNEDHSEPAAPLMVNTLSSQFPGKNQHKPRKQLRYAVIGKALVRVDLPSDPVLLQPGDQVLLASDGLETLSDADVAVILGRTASLTPAAAVARLLKHIRRARSQDQDNATILLYRAGGQIEESVGPFRRGMLLLFGALILLGAAVAAIRFLR
jgi:PPM family protein phosphatase